MKKENYDDIKKLFSEETDLPAELSKENMTKKLALVPPKKKRNIKTFSKYIAAAAAVMIVAIGALNINLGGFEKEVNFNDISVKQSAQAVDTEEEQKTGESIAYAPIDLGIKPNKMSQFSDNKDLENYFLNIERETKGSLYDRIRDNLYGLKSDGAEMEIVDFIASDNEALTTAASAYYAPTQSGVGDASEDFTSQNTAHTETNTQVKGVDEADIIKNDGRYLYIVSDDSLLTIVDTETMEAVFSKKIESNSKKVVFYANEIYLGGDTLVVVCSEYEENKEVWPGFYNTKYTDSLVYTFVPGSKTVNIVYDVSDKSNPKELRRFTQDGSLNSTRMIGSVLYTVTNYSVNIYGNDNLKDECYPCVDGRKMDASEIYVIDKKGRETAYFILSAFDTANSASEVNSISVLGYSDHLYCSGNMMYVAQNYYDTETRNSVVNIYSFALDGDKVTYKASGAVPGSVYTQYFIDEFGGYLRIATNDYDYNEDEDVSSLYALDAQLNVVGKLENFAVDEQVKSVRFMGDTAYVVTFKNTDPLFAIDLSDPSKLKILGEVKLPGYSEYMHSVGNGLLVGIGYDGDEENANFSTVKITLFDVSDKTNPKVLDTHVIKNASSDVNYEPKAFFFYAEENIIGIPLSYYNDYGVVGENYQFKLLKIENGKFTDKHNFAHPNDNDYALFFRGSYIADNLYTITNHSIAQFDIASGELIKTLTYVPLVDSEVKTGVEVTRPPFSARNNGNVTFATTEPPVTEAEENK